jgi:hypothetical protein
VLYEIDDAKHVVIGLDIRHRSAACRRRRAYFVQTYGIVQMSDLDERMVGELLAAHVGPLLGAAVTGPRS